MKNFKKGFTLIELLVVIAIIGILSSIVLASLASARTKGQDSSIVSTLAQVRSQGEIYYNTTGAGTYGGATTAGATECETVIFGATATGGLDKLVESVKAKVGGVTNMKCVAIVTPAAYAIAAKTSTGFHCVDSKGNSKATTTATLAQTISDTTATCN